MKLQITIQPRKPIEKWSNRDFLIYFSNLLLDKTGNKLEIPTEAWVGYMSRMKGFRSKLNLSNEAYKEFIDTVFSQVFTRGGYVPVFGAIVSEKVYGMVRSKPISVRAFGNYDFESIRNDLYSNGILFQKLPEDYLLSMKARAI